MVDFFVVVANCSQVEILRNLFERRFILKLSYEVQAKKLISILDTIVLNHRNRVTTPVYKKPTDAEEL